MDLARQQRMNTDVRCAIFIALMSSEDFLDAYDRLQRLKLKNKQEREIPRVVLHCCSNERVYNPFYALVAGKLCETHSLKKTFQFSLWDYVTELQGEDDEGGPVKGQYKDDDDETRIRRISHFARFFASLVGQGSMTLDILKTVNFLAASPNLKLFLEAFFVALFQIVSKRAETAQGSRQSYGGAMFEHKRNGNEVAAMLIKTKDKLVLEGMRYFLPSVVTSSAVGTKKKQIERVKWGVNLAYDMIDEILSNQKEAMSD
jgi:nucleolar MIF4G domain-containing protein 1